MAHTITIVALLLLFSCLCKSELMFVMEVFRHGARQPLYDWWNARNFTHWGELTAVGMRQHYNLGQALRKIYIDDLAFLSPQFDPSEIYVRSTDVNRTLQSALSQLYGLFPLLTGPEMPKGLDPQLEQAPFSGFQNASESFYGLPFGFQPVPIHTVPSSEEFMLRSFDSICKVSDDLYNYVLNSSQYVQWNQDFKPTFEEIGRVLNLSQETIGKMTIEDLSDIYDVFMDDKWYNLQIPQNISAELWKNLTIAYNIVIYYCLGGIKEANQFYSTPFFREIIASLDTKLKTPSNPLKWKMYSAHDWTVATFATALNITDYACTIDLLTKGSTDALNCELYPDFATSLLIELHQNSTAGQFVKIRYNGDYVNLCERREKECSYTEFRQRVSDYLVDFEKICNSDKFVVDSADAKKTHAGNFLSKEKMKWNLKFNIF